LFIAFLPFILFASICIIYSPVAGTAAQKTLSYFLVILVAPNLLQKLLFDDHERIIKGLTFLFSIVLYAGLALKFLMPEFSTLEGRFTGLFGNPNGLGIYASITFAFFSIMVNRFPEHFNLFLKVLIYAGLMLSIWFCGSRNALVAVMLFILFRNIYGLSPYIGFLIFLLLVVSFTYIQNNLVPIIIGLGLEEYFRIETLEGGSGRTIAWDFAWEQIDKDPYIGKGFAYTEYIFKENYNYLSMLGHQGNAHNSYLTIWMDTGFIGLFFFAVAFIGQFIRASRGSVLAIPALYLVLFSGNFESWIAASLNPVTILVWMMLALMTFPKEELARDEETEEEPEEESGNLVPAHV
jgi:O-antigen ligase